jgi:hypothetical protein
VTEFWIFFTLCWAPPLALVFYFYKKMGDRA